MEYGLIGKTLGHSFSKIVHEALTDYGYELYPLPTQEEFHDFMRVKNFRGINVTIPYKQDVIPYCNSLDEKAQAIGAVNTIVNENGVLKGYNTDFDGFLFQCETLGISFQDKVVLILGTGGTFKTVWAVAQSQKAKEILVASRSRGEGKLSYAMAQSPEIAEKIDILINTSPVGMYPHNQEMPVDLSHFPHVSGVIDVIYNPQNSLLVQAGKARGIPSSGGLAMLVAQAKYAAEYFTQKTIETQAMEKVLGQIAHKQSNLVLVGMPASGKSTIGRKVAQMMHRGFVDLDEALVKKANRSIPEIFAQEGEEAFRSLETEICWEYGKESGLVLSTGGGVVTREENIRALGQNAVFVYITRPIDTLDVGKHRPLSQSREDILRLHQERSPIYEKIAHKTVENSQAVHIVAKEVQEAYYEIFHSSRAKS